MIFKGLIWVAQSAICGNIQDAVIDLATFSEKTEQIGNSRTTTKKRLKLVTVASAT